MKSKFGFIPLVIFIAYIGLISVSQYIKTSSGVSDAKADLVHDFKRKKINKPILDHYAIPRDKPLWINCRTDPKNLNRKRCHNDIEVCYFNKTDISCYEKTKNK